MFVRPSVRMVTSPFISNVWCSRPYKPYIFLKLIIWWWQLPRQRLTESQIQRQRQRHTDRHRQIQIQSASKTQCMLYFLKAGGSRISNMAFPPKLSTKHFPHKLFTKKISTTISYQTFPTKTNFPPVHKWTHCSTDRSQHTKTSLP